MPSSPRNNRNHQGAVASAGSASGGASAGLGKPPPYNGFVDKLDGNDKQRRLIRELAQGNYASMFGGFGSQANIGEGPGALPLEWPTIPEMKQIVESCFQAARSTAANSYSGSDTGIGLTALCRFASHAGLTDVRPPWVGSQRDVNSPTASSRRRAGIVSNLAATATGQHLLTAGQISDVFRFATLRETSLTLDTFWMVLVHLAILSYPELFEETLKSKTQHQQQSANAETAQGKDMFDLSTENLTVGTASPRRGSDASAVGNLALPTVGGSFARSSFSRQSVVDGMAAASFRGSAMLNGSGAVGGAGGAGLLDGQKHAAVMMTMLQRLCCDKLQAYVRLHTTTYPFPEHYYRNVMNTARVLWRFSEGLERLFEHYARADLENGMQLLEFESMLGEFGLQSTLSNEATEAIFFACASDANGLRRVPGNFDSSVPNTKWALSFDDFLEAIARTAAEVLCEDIFARWKTLEAKVEHFITSTVQPAFSATFGITLPYEPTDVPMPTLTHCSPNVINQDGGRVQLYGHLFGALGRGVWLVSNLHNAPRHILPTTDTFMVVDFPICEGHTWEKCTVSCLPFGGLDEHGELNETASPEDLEELSEGSGGNTSPAPAGGEFHPQHIKPPVIEERLVRVSYSMPLNIAIANSPDDLPFVGAPLAPLATVESKLEPCLLSKETLEKLKKLFDEGCARSSVFNKSYLYDSSWLWLSRRLNVSIGPFNRGALGFLPHSDVEVEDTQKTNSGGYTEHFMLQNVFSHLAKPRRGDGAGRRSLLFDHFVELMLRITLSHGSPAGQTEEVLLHLLIPRSDEPLIDFSSPTGISATPGRQGTDVVDASPSPKETGSTRKKVVVVEDEPEGREGSHSVGKGSMMNRKPTVARQDALMRSVVKERQTAEHYRQSQTGLKLKIAEQDETIKKWRNIHTSCARSISEMKGLIQLLLSTPAGSVARKDSDAGSAGASSPIQLATTDNGSFNSGGMSKSSAEMQLLGLNAKLDKSRIGVDSKGKPPSVKDVIESQTEKRFTTLYRATVYEMCDLTIKALESETPPSAIAADSSFYAVPAEPSLQNASMASPKGQSVTSPPGGSPARRKSNDRGFDSTVTSATGNAAMASLLNADGSVNVACFRKHLEALVIDAQSKVNAMTTVAAVGSGAAAGGGRHSKEMVDMLSSADERERKSSKRLKELEEELTTLKSDSDRKISELEVELAAVKNEAAASEKSLFGSRQQNKEKEREIGRLKQHVERLQRMHRYAVPEHHASDRPTSTQGHRLSATPSAMQQLAQTYSSSSGPLPSIDTNSQRNTPPPTPHQPSSRPNASVGGAARRRSSAAATPHHAPHGHPMSQASAAQAAEAQAILKNKLAAATAEAEAGKREIEECRMDRDRAQQALEAQKSETAKLEKILSAVDRWAQLGGDASSLRRSLASLRGTDVKPLEGFAPLDSQSTNNNLSASHDRSAASPAPEGDEGGTTEPRRQKKRKPGASSKTASSKSPRRKGKAGGGSSRMTSPKDSSLSGHKTPSSGQFSRGRSNSRHSLGESDDGRQSPLSLSIPASPGGSSLYGNTVTVSDSWVQTEGGVIKTCDKCARIMKQERKLRLGAVRIQFNTMAVKDELQEMKSGIQKGLAAQKHQMYHMSKAIVAAIVRSHGADGTSSPTHATASTTTSQQPPSPLHISGTDSDQLSASGTGDKLRVSTEVAPNDKNRRSSAVHAAVMGNRSFAPSVANQQATNGTASASVDAPGGMSATPQHQRQQDSSSLNSQPRTVAKGSKPSGDNSESHSKVDGVFSNTEVATEAVDETTPSAGTPAQPASLSGTGVFSDLQGGSDSISRDGSPHIGRDTRPGATQGGGVQDDSVDHLLGTGRITARVADNAHPTALSSMEKRAQQPIAAYVKLDPSEVEAKDENQRQAPAQGKSKTATPASGIAAAVRQPVGPSLFAVKGATLHQHGPSQPLRTAQDNSPPSEQGKEVSSPTDASAPRPLMTVKSEPHLTHSRSGDGAGQGATGSSSGVAASLLSKEDVMRAKVGSGQQGESATQTPFRPAGRGTTTSRAEFGSSKQQHPFLNQAGPASLAPKPDPASVAAAIQVRSSAQMQSQQLAVLKDASSTKRKPSPPPPKEAQQLEEQIESSASEPTISTISHTARKSVHMSSQPQGGTRPPSAVSPHDSSSDTRPLVLNTEPSNRLPAVTTMAVHPYKNTPSSDGHSDAPTEESPAFLLTKDSEESNVAPPPPRRRNTATGPPLPSPPPPAEPIPGHESLSLAPVEEREGYQKPQSAQLYKGPATARTPAHKPQLAPGESVQGASISTRFNGAPQRPHVNSLSDRLAMHAALQEGREYMVGHGSIPSKGTPHRMHTGAMQLVEQHRPETADDANIDRRELERLALQRNDSTLQYRHVYRAGDGTYHAEVSDPPPIAKPSTAPIGVQRAATSPRSPPPVRTPRFDDVDIGATTEGEIAPVANPTPTLPSIAGLLMDDDDQPPATSQALVPQDVESQQRRQDAVAPVAFDAMLSSALSTGTTFSNRRQIGNGKPLVDRQEVPANLRARPVQQVPMGPNPALPPPSRLHGHGTAAPPSSKQKMAPVFAAKIPAGAKKPTSG